MKSWKRTLIWAIHKIVSWLLTKSFFDKVVQTHISRVILLFEKTKSHLQLFGEAEFVEKHRTRKGVRKASDFSVKHGKTKAGGGVLCRSEDNIVLWQRLFIAYYLLANARNRACPKPSSVMRERAYAEDWRFVATRTEWGPVSNKPPDGVLIVFIQPPADFERS